MTEENKNIMTTLNRKLGTRTIRRFALLIMIMTLVFGLLGCAKDAAEIAEDKGGVTAQMVIENPDAYIGKTVTVKQRLPAVAGYGNAKACTPQNRLHRPQKIRFVVNNQYAFSCLHFEEISSACF
jgi:hypothetical protein